VLEQVRDLTKPDPAMEKKRIELHRLAAKAMRQKPDGEWEIIDEDALNAYHSVKWDGEVFECKFCGEQIAWPGVCAACEKRLDSDELTTEGKLAMLGVPNSMATCEWGNFEHPAVGTREGREVEEVKRWRGRPAMLVFSGKPGTGKTHMAVSVMRTRIADKGSAGMLFLADMEIGARLKAGFKDDGLAVEDQLRDARLLIIDDFGQGYQTAWIRDTVVPILCHRMDNDKPTILTTNLTGEDLNSVDARLTSRLQLALRVGTSGLKDARKTPKKDHGIVEGP